MRQRAVYGRTGTNTRKWSGMKSLPSLMNAAGKRRRKNPVRLFEKVRSNSSSGVMTRKKRTWRCSKGDWWAKGAEMLRANTIKPAEARSVLQRMKKQLKDPSTKVTTPEQLECIYELIIKTAKISPSSSRTADASGSSEMLANNFP